MFGIKTLIDEIGTYGRFGVAKLDNMTFRINPSDISFDYSVDYATIPTLGGQVIQVLGCTLGDLTIRGLFGEDRTNKQLSWELAESFHAQIRALMDKQTIPSNKDVHRPFRFTFIDREHNWDMKVLIKDIQDLDGDGTVSHGTGKFSYGYVLTLFIVEDSTLTLSKVASDRFIQRISKGVGWKKTFSSDMNNTNYSFSGSENGSAVQEFLHNTANQDITALYNAAQQAQQAGDK